MKKRNCVDVRNNERDVFCKVGYFISVDVVGVFLC